MKILITGGGFSGITSSICKSLQSKENIEVTIVPLSLRILNLRWLFIVLIALESFLTYGIKFRKFFNRTWFSYYAKSLACDALVKKHTPDVVIQIGTNNLNFKREKENTVFSIFTDHVNLLSKKLPDYGFEIPEKQISHRWNRIEERILQSQDHIFVMSNKVRNSMIYDYGVDQNRIKTVGGGPNLDVDIERDGIEKKYTDKNILFVGLDAERKGLLDLVAAFDIVQKQFSDAKLHIVGVDGKSSDSVVYHGEVRGERLKELFFNSQIFCLPAYREPFGIVFLEALYSKCVCIGTNIEAMPEIIDHGKTGYLCEPKNVDEISKYISDLFSDSNRLKDMAEAGYKSAKKNWGWDQTIDEILSSLES
jgi:glycosyltransferase involved in cell wall biosynthesis